MTIRTLLQVLHRLAAEMGADTDVQIRGLGKMADIDYVRPRNGKGDYKIAVIAARVTSKNNPAAEEEAA